MRLTFMDWAVVISMFVAATFGLMAYAHANFVTREEKVDLVKSMDLLRSEIILLRQDLKELPLNRQKQ